VDEAEEDVLGADVGVVEEARFFLRQDHHSPRPVGKAFEQFDRPSPLPSPAMEQLKKSVSAALGDLAPQVVTC
jgi:hypothetical protein